MTRYRIPPPASLAAYGGAAGPVRRPAGPDQVGLLPGGHDRRGGAAGDATSPTDG